MMRQFQKELISLDKKLFRDFVCFLYGRGTGKYKIIFYVNPALFARIHEFRGAPD